MFKKFLGLTRFIQQDIDQIRKMAPPLMLSRLNSIELYLTKYNKKLCQKVLTLLK